MSDSRWEAVYKSNRGQEVRIPLVEDGTGKVFVETKSGRLEPYTVTLEDKKLGHLVHFRTERIAEQPPMPSSPELEAAIQTLKQRLYQFPTLQLNEFVNKQPGLKTALDKDFAGVPIEKIQKWITLADEKIAADEAAKKAARPKPIFEVEARRRNFMGTRLGSLFVEENVTPSSRENSWNGTFKVRCDQCKTLFGTIRVEHILEMQSGWRDPFVCGQPCVKVKG